MAAPNSNGSLSGRFSGFRRLRRASFISPATGERSKRTFTLRDASHRDEERAPLLNGHNQGPTDGTTEQPSTLWQSYRSSASEQASKGWQFVTSKTGQGIFKCSLAYIIGSLATFVPTLAGLIGDKQDSKHMVATVTVWFHPARSIGSMHEATVLAFIAFCYSGLVSFTSMAVSMFFANQDLLVVGHAVVLVVFIGGGLGLIAWVKQRLGHPLVNVACSLASLGCITVLIKEGTVQAGAFSHDRVLQVLLMVIMGVVIVTVVNLLILPTTARGALVKDMEKTTDLLGEILISITRAFLSGRRSDLEDAYFKKLNSDHQAASSSMSKNMGEAKRELCLLGKERQYDLEARLVDCLTGLAQDLGGLRSAAFAQFAFMDEASAEVQQRSSVKDIKPPPTKSGPVTRPNILGSITEDPEDIGFFNGHLTSACDTPFGTSRSPMSPNRRASVDSLTLLETPTSLEKPGSMFVAFLTQLGPPTKSLVFTLKQILDELPFESTLR